MQVNLIKQIGDRHLFELLRGSFVALFFKAIGVVSIFLFMYVVSQIYGSDGYGLYSILWAILVFGSVVAKIGFDSSIVKFIAGFYAKKNFKFIKRIYKKGLSWITIIGVAVGIIICLLSKQFSVYFFESDEYADLVVFVGFLVLPFSILNYNAETLKGLKNITAFSLFQNGPILIITLMMMGGFVYFRKMPADIMYSLGGAILVLVPISFILLRYNFRKKFCVGAGHAKKFPLTNKSILKTTMPMLYAGSLFYIMGWTDTLMISANMSNADVGIYNAALKIATISSTILVAVNSIAMPKYAELVERNDYLLFRNFVKQTSLLILLISAPFFVMIFAFPTFMLNIFAPDYVLGREALLILACGHFFSAVSGSTIHLLNMTGKEKIARNILLVSALINVVLNYLLIPKFGITGAAIATASTTILWNALAVYFIYRQFGFLTLPFKVKVRK